MQLRVVVRVFFNDTASTEIYTLSLHDALPIFDRADPDPGRVTLRRLNRVEYRNTIRDLMGVDYDTSNQFPADDAGDRKSTRLNSSHSQISYAVFCLKKKKEITGPGRAQPPKTL